MRTKRHRLPNSEAGAIRIRSVFEITVLLVVVYAVFQVAPVVTMRINFLNEIEVIAHSPIQDSGVELKQRVLEAARDRGILLGAGNVFVQRDRARQKTIIDATYQLRVDVFPGVGFDWNVQDHVEALLL